MKRGLLLLMCLLFIGCSKEDKEVNQVSVGVVPDNSTDVLVEEELYNLIMKYRKENGLGEIPYSKNLSVVAQIHAKDLAENSPVGGKCNMHSWSDKGSWLPVCYTSDHANAKLMWSKPSELTSYKGYGYEIAAMNSSSKAESFLSLWKNSPAHNHTILNQGIWKKEWKAIGIGVYKGYAMVWFGHLADEN